MAFTLQIGDTAPDFHLKSTTGKFYRLDEFKEDTLVLFFTCNHCPYVTGSDEHTRMVVDRFSSQGVDFVAINSNSKNTYAEDDFEGMIDRMDQYSFPWVYLHDESQDIAISYGALRTPHFYVFNKDRKLVYTGRSIDTPRNWKDHNHTDLIDALEQHLQGKEIENPLTNPIGCNVKWEGQDKHWMPSDACDLV